MNTVDKTVVRGMRLLTLWKSTELYDGDCVIYYKTTPRAILTLSRWRVTWNCYNLLFLDSNARMHPALF